MKGFKGDKHKTMCCVCNEVINIESMGESALKSHMEGEKQKETLELDIDSLVKWTDDLSVKAEETGQPTLANKSNAL